MGEWTPGVEFHRALTAEDDGQAALGRPYPFFLANPIKDGTDFEEPPFGDADDWVAEWKWDGIRAQIVKRAGQVFIWSRGEELVTDQFPEISRAAASLPDGVVLDGEILAWSERDQKPLEFQQLQRRLGRKVVSQRTIDNHPVVLLAFDLLEQDGRDLRQQPLELRQQQLRSLVETASQTVQSSGGFLFPEMNQLAHAIRLPPVVAGSTWSEWSAERERSQEMSAEGLMLKRKTSSYQVNRPVGDWWKWKVDPYTIDAVLVYAQRGHGRRASLYTDYTFAVWDDGQLVPFAKAYSGLTDAEINRVDTFVRKHTEESFGPVRRVTPQLVFELAFENIQSSSRHKSGIAVRFPRINRWRHDKQPEDADTLDAIKQMIGVG
jgi:DNA ligase-1